MSKINIYGQLSNCLFELFKSQLSHFQKSAEQIDDFFRIEENRIEKTVFQNQNSSNNVEKLSIDGEFALENAHTSTPLNKTRKVLSNLSVNQLGKSSENLYKLNSSQPFIPSIFYTNEKITNKNDITKAGYLYKKSFHSRVKNWLKRKCLIQDGNFFIYHSDVLY
jgi:hypothetical protein